MLKNFSSRPWRDDLLCGTALAAGLGAYFYGVSAIFGPWVPSAIAGLITSLAGVTGLAESRKGVLPQFASANPFGADSSVCKNVNTLAQRAGVESPRVYLGNEYAASPLFRIIIIPPEALTESRDLRKTALPPIAHEIAHLKFDKLVATFEHLSKCVLNATSSWLALGVVGVSAGAAFFPSLPSVPVHGSLGVIGLFNVLGHLGINYSSRVREVRADRMAGHLLKRPDALKDCLVGMLPFYERFRDATKQPLYGLICHFDLFSTHPSSLRRIMQLEKDALKSPPPLRGTGPLVHPSESVKMTAR